MRDKRLAIGTRVTIVGWTAVPFTGLTGTIKQYHHHAAWGHFEGYWIALDDTPRARAVTKSNGWRQRDGATDAEAIAADLARHIFSDENVEPTIGTALSRIVGGDEPLVTRGYIRELYHLAAAFQDGWHQCSEEVNGDPREYPRYAELRDFLRGYMDVDYVSACQVALYLAQDLKHVPWRDDIVAPAHPFQPVV